jgi:polyisoprenoid-binding protein YceI
MSRSVTPLALLLLSVPVAPHPGRARVAPDGPELFAIDPIHSQVEFTVPFMGLTTVKGRFEDFAGALLYDPLSLTNSSVTVVIRSASVHTGNELRDRHLRSSDFLDVARYPVIVFQSRRILTGEAGALVVEGELTLRGVTRPLGLPVRVRHPLRRDPNGVDYLGFDDTVQVNWRSFAIPATNANNSWFQPDRMLVSDSLLVTITLEATRRHPARIAYPELEAVRGAVSSSGLRAYLVRLAQAQAAGSDSLGRLSRVLLDLGRAWYEGGRGPEAVALLQALSRDTLQGAGPLTELAQAYLSGGDTVAARPILRRAVRVDPFQAEAAELLRRVSPPDSR